MDECNHDRYRTSEYMQYGAAMRDADICWIGMRIQTCHDCGEDLSQYRIVPVKTVPQYLKSIER